MATIMASSVSENPQTIYDSLTKIGYPLKRYSGDIGIEVETECLKPYDVPELKFWSSHRDNSLRDFGIEYVTRGAISRGTETRLALDELDQRVFKVYKLKPDSFSTSVHTHLNFLNSTWRHLVQFFVAYYLSENLLVRFSGPDRLSNNFCLPMCDAEGELNIVLEIIRSIDRLNYRKIAISPETSKYSALNLGNLTKLGTLEVRTMRGVTDITLIQQWVDILLSIKDYSDRAESPASILNQYEKIGPDGLMKEIFGEHLKAIDSSIDGGQKVRNSLVEKNLWYASKIATIVKFDDPNWGFPKPKKILRTKYTERLDTYAIDIFKKPYNQLEFAMKTVVEEALNRELNMVNGVIFSDGDQ